MAHDKTIQVWNSGHVSQLTNEVDHIVPQKNSNIYKIAPNNIKSLCTQIENMLYESNDDHFAI